MGLLRENKDTLMTVLDPFIHDPLVEWEDEKRKIVSRMICPDNRRYDQTLTTNGYRNDRRIGGMPTTGLRSICAYLQRMP